MQKLRKLVIKIQSYIQQIRIEIYVLMSLFIFVLGFTRSYYRWQSNIASDFDWTYFANYFSDNPNTTTGWGIFAFMIVIIAHVAIIALVTKQKAYTEAIRRLFISTVVLMSGLFLFQWLYLIVHEDFVFRFRYSEYSDLFDITVSISHGYSFAFFWFLSTLPVILMIALLYKSYTGKQPVTLYEWLDGMLNKEEKK